MLTGLFRKNFPLVLALTPLVASIFWGFSFYKPVHTVTDDTAPLYRAFAEVLKDHVWIQQAISIVLICMQAALLNRTFNRHDILDRETYLPALFYVVLMSCLYGLQAFHPFILFNLFFILAIRSLLGIRRQLDSRKNTFMAGLYIGLASLCYAPGILLTLHIWLALLILRPFVWREWLLPLAGASLSYLYLWVYYFLTDTQDQFAQLFRRGEESYSIAYSEYPELKYALFGLFGIIVLVSIFKLLSSFRTHSVRFRKLVQVNLAMAGILGLIDLATYFTNFDNYSIAPYAPVVAMLLGYYFYLSWSKIVPRILYYLAFVVILLNLFFQVR